MTRWGSTPDERPDTGAPIELPVRSEVRLRMKARPATHGVSGGWWPRSRAAMAEFPELVLVMSSWVGPVCRVTYHVDDWVAAGQEMAVDGWLVELVGITTVARHTVLVTGTNQRERSVLVVPPEVPGGVARAVLRSAAGPDLVPDASDLLASNGVRVDLRDAGEVSPERR